MTLKSELEQDELKRQEVKALAEVNEYMYNQLKENGIAVKMVRNIATAFFEMSTDNTTHPSHELSHRSSPSHNPSIHGSDSESETDGFKQSLVASVDSEEDKNR